MRGALSAKFSIEPLLQVLGNHRSTGKLVVMHPVRGRFAAFLEDGRLVHVEYGAETGVDGLATMMFDARGEFEFYNDEKSSSKTIRGMLEFALITASNLARRRTGVLQSVKIKAKGGAKLLEPERGMGRYAGEPEPEKKS